jgi:glycosyltransferase involved in cell wall biosynthesis
VREARKVVQDFHPDLIHFHGTEECWATLKTDRLVDRPAVLSIQGLMAPYARYAWGDKGFWEVLPMVRLFDIRTRLALLTRRANFRKRARREARFLNAVDAVLGRTDFDRSYTWAVAPRTQYYHVDEIMRPEFFRTQWSLEGCNRHRVYTSGRLTFTKGMHTFIEAMALLKRDYPDLQLCIAGSTNPSGECRHIQRLIRKRGLADHTEFVGWIPSPAIAEQLRRAHCYVNPSFIENSSNAIVEAGLVGVPCVAAFAGGTSSQIHHGETGLLFPRGNAFMMADCVRSVFENDVLANRLSATVRDVIRSRYDPDKIVSDLIAAYRSIVQ